MKSGNFVILFINPQRTIVRFADISIVPSFTINSTLTMFLRFESDAAQLLIVYMNQFYCNRIYIREKLQDYMLKIDS